MTDSFDIPRLIELRKLTRSVSERIETQLKSYLSTLAPLFSPQPILGEYIRGGSKSSVKGAEKNFQELKKHYLSIARQKPYSLDSDISPPLDIFAATPALTPVTYPYKAENDGKTAELTVTSPLQWILSYPGMSPNQITDLLKGNRSQIQDELAHTLLQCLTLNLVLEKQTGLRNLLKDLRFKLETIQVDSLGDLPVLLISCPISTELPSDDVIIQNTEISGIPSFEEIIKINDIRIMSDPLRETLLGITQEVTPEIYQELVS
ncbi:MAG: hypothetical protein JAY84_05415 [Candidatus Thiodiazotropha taylori]|nr:hypothetical protein [Candidatus Thiodiazotropha taylori]MCG8067282.1 hypothetical protein [Candidatus Thiodiazotropha taylori]